MFGFFTNLVNLYAGIISVKTLRNKRVFFGTISVSISVNKNVATRNKF